MKRASMIRILPVERRGLATDGLTERNSFSAEDAVAVAYRGLDGGDVGHAGAPAGRYEKATGRKVEPHLGQKVALSGKLLPHWGQVIG